MRSTFTILLLLAGCNPPPTGPAGQDGTSAPEPTGNGGNGGLSASIDHVAFDYLTAFDGSGISVVVRPVILFQAGVVCDCADEDLETLDLADVQKRRPKDLGEWRTNGGTIEVKWSTTWRALGVRVAALALGDGWRSQRSYNRTTSMGAGDSWVGASHTLAFDGSGRFRLEGATGTSVSSSSSSSQGTYNVAGWMLTLQFDDGHKTRMSAVTSADQPEGVLWLAGASYTQ
jgi:hypothetical protein